MGDVVKANIKALTEGSLTFFNIGTGKGTKTSELYHVVYEAVRAIKPELPKSLSKLSRQEARPGDIPRSCLVIDKARDRLGWEPETGLREGIRLTLQWRAGKSP